MSINENFYYEQILAFIESDDEKSLVAFLIENRISSNTFSEIYSLKIIDYLKSKKAISELINFIDDHNTSIEIDFVLLESFFADGYLKQYKHKLKTLLKRCLFENNIRVGLKVINFLKTSRTKSDLYSTFVECILLSKIGHFEKINDLLSLIDRELVFLFKKERININTGISYLRSLLAVIEQADQTNIHVRKIFLRLLNRVSFLSDTVISGMELIEVLLIFASDEDELLLVKDIIDKSYLVDLKDVVNLRRKHPLKTLKKKSYTKSYDFIQSREVLLDWDSLESYGVRYNRSDVRHHFNLKYDQLSDIGYSESNIETFDALFMMGAFEACLKIIDNLDSKKCDYLRSICYYEMAEYTLGLECINKYLIQSLTEEDYVFGLSLKEKILITSSQEVAAENVRSLMLSLDMSVDLVQRKILHERD